MLTDAKLNRWYSFLNKYRDSLDLSTLIWLWLSLGYDDVENEVDKEKTLWSDIYYLIVDDASDLIFDRYIRDMDHIDMPGLVGKIIVTCDPPKPIEPAKDKEWFIEYYKALLPLISVADTYTESLTDFDLDFERFGHPILSHREPVLKCINLDDLVTRFTEMGFEFPSEFKRRNVLADNQKPTNSLPASSNHRQEMDGKGFRLYKILPDLNTYLWKDSAGEVLRNSGPAKGWAKVLAEVFLVKKSNANEMRIVTSEGHDTVERYLVPLILILWDSAEVSYELYSLSSESKAKMIGKICNFKNEGASAALFRIATPECALKTGTKLNGNLENAKCKVKQVKVFLDADISMEDRNKAEPLYLDLQAKFKKELTFP